MSYWKWVFLVIQVSCWLYFWMVILGRLYARVHTLHDLALPSCEGPWLCPYKGKVCLAALLNDPASWCVMRFHEILWEIWGLKMYNFFFLIWHSTVCLLMAQHRFIDFNLLKPECSRLTRSAPLLLMPWLLVLPGHQQSWYWLIPSTGQVTWND